MTLLEQAAKAAEQDYNDNAEHWQCPFDMLKTLKQTELIIRYLAEHPSDDMVEAFNSAKCDNKYVQDRISAALMAVVEEGK